MRILLVLWLCCAGCALAQKKPGTPGPLHLEVNTPSQPGAVRFDDQGRARADLTSSPVQLDPVEGQPLPYQGIRRDLPWWASPEIPLGPGRAWPDAYPAYGTPWGPGWPGPRLPYGGWGGWYGPYW